MTKEMYRMQNSACWFLLTKRFGDKHAKKEIM